MHQTGLLARAEVDALLLGLPVAPHPIEMRKRSGRPDRQQQSPAAGTPKASNRRVHGQLACARLATHVSFLVLS
eukprot:360309-Chlamydomonas_euryale.AAC.2